MLEIVIAELEARDAREVCVAAGVSYQWYEKLKYGRSVRPAYWPIQAVYDYCVEHPRSKVGRPRRTQS